MVQCYNTDNIQVTLISPPSQSQNIHQQSTNPKNSPSYSDIDNNNNNNNNNICSSFSSCSKSSLFTNTADSSSTISMVSSNSIAYICIISDLTDASNTCKRHVINLSSTYTIENLINEAANFYSYDPSTFYLMWKHSNQLINISELSISLTSLGELGLIPGLKNHFEIHEKEGPPKRRIKIDQSYYDDRSSESSNYTTTGIPMSSICGASSPPSSDTNNNNNNDNNNNNTNNNFEYGPVNSSSNIFNERVTIYSSFSGSNNNNNYSNNSNNDDETGYVGLINQAMTCYLNSLLQTLFMTPEFRNGIYRWKCLEAINGGDMDEDGGKKSIPFQLQRLFLNLQTSNKKSIQTSDLTKSFGWNSDDAFQQHDVQELCRVMFDALEKNFKGTEQENLINELYQGKIKDYVKCLECNIESARVNVFLDISLCIRPFGSDKTYESVEEALDAFVQPEILDENNKYFCDKCNRMCKAHKGLKFESFPYIISLQLNRFDFDYSTMSRFKISNTVSFPETLNIKKYLNKETKNEQISTNNSNVNTIDDENNPDSIESKENIEKIISQVEEAVNDIDENEDSSTNKTKQDQIEDEQDSDKSKYDYELFSIMIHSGNATGGHYYAYIKCFETNQWYNFNDERVSKLDKRDIKKAFGASFSMYSSTTAYMLLYRQKNEQRNEKFIKIDEFNDYLKSLFSKERSQRLEADRLKEYMDNSCKIKVVVPSIHSNINSETIPSNNQNNSSDFNNLTKKREKTVNLHKDLTLEQAKEELIKEFNLTDYFETGKNKCRILKYDTYNDLIEESYKNESINTVFEALGFTKYPYGFCWYLEILPFDEEVIEYSSSDFNIKVINLNMTTFETNDLFHLRMKSDSTVMELRENIGRKLNILNTEMIRMALERPHNLCNYVYLNKNLNDTLKSQYFTRVNKVFIEYDQSIIQYTDSTIEQNNNSSLEYSKFYYALDAIMNMLQMIVYLPVEEQCDMFMRKTQRRNLYIENQRNILRKKKTEEMQQQKNATLVRDENENTMESCYFDTTASVTSTSNCIQSANPCLYSILAETTDSMSTDNLSPINNKNNNNNNCNIDKIATRTDSNSSSNISIQLESSSNTNKTNINLIEDHFKTSNRNNNNNNNNNNDNSSRTKSKNSVNNNNFNEMETSLDEGIGSSGSASNNNAKNSPNSENLKASPINFDYQLLAPAVESEEINGENRSINNNNNKKLIDSILNREEDEEDEEITTTSSSNLLVYKINNQSAKLNLDQINIETGELTTCKRGAEGEVDGLNRDEILDYEDDDDNDRFHDDLDVNVDDNEINNIDDDFNENSNLNSNLNDADLDQDHDIQDLRSSSKENLNENNFYHCYDDLLMSKFRSNRPDDDNDNSTNNINDNNEENTADMSNEFKFKPRSVKFNSQTQEINDQNNNNSKMWNDHYPVHVSGSDFPSIDRSIDDNQNNNNPNNNNNNNNQNSPNSEANINMSNNCNDFLSYLNKGRNIKSPKDVFDNNKDNTNLNDDDDIDRLPKYSELKNRVIGAGDDVQVDQQYVMQTQQQKLSENRFIKSNLISNVEMGAGTLEVRMDKRIDLNEFKSHVNEYLKIGNDNFRVFRMCPNDLECELTSSENQFSYLTQNTKFVIKLGPPLKYGEYVLPVFKLNQNNGTFSYLCDFMIVHGLSVLNHKELLREDLKDENNLDIPIDKMRLRKKIAKRPGAILLDNDGFGVDIFMNAMSELCVEILDGSEKKTNKNQTSVYLRHWKPDEYELSELMEVIIEGNSYDLLLNSISSISGIPIEHIEVLKCKRDFPFKSPILDLHKDLSWKDNYFLPMEKLEDGVCFYFRNKTLKLGEISEEKRREMVKEDNINFRPTLSFALKKEIGIKIHVENR